MHMANLTKNPLRYENSMDVEVELSLDGGSWLLVFRSTLMMGYVRTRHVLQTIVSLVITIRPGN